MDRLPLARATGMHAVFARDHGNVTPTRSVSSTIARFSAAGQWPRGERCFAALAGAIVSQPVAYEEVGLIGWGAAIVALGFLHGNFHERNHNGQGQYGTRRAR